MFAEVSSLIVSQDGTVVTNQYFDVPTLAALASTLVPLLVSLVTKQSASDGLKAVVNIVATAVIAVLALWANPSDVQVTWQYAVTTFLTALVTSFVAYKGLWKPTGVAGTITAATPNVGLGPKPVLQTADKGAEDLGQAGQ